MYSFLKDSIGRNFRIVKEIKKTEDKHLYKARHNETGQYYFIREFKGSAEAYLRMVPIKSPFLPEIYEAVSDSGNALIIEEYIAGDSLSDLICGLPLAEKEAKKISLDICRALYTLHRSDIVHRDVKPGNIRIRSGTDTAVLVDFDSSRRIKADQSRDTVQLGTTGYAAPEQYGIVQTDGRPDIYALGVTMNLMLTGVHPSERLAPGKLGRIISKCTMVHPDKRYPNVLRLMEALE